MADRAEHLREAAWELHDHLVHDLENLDDVLARHEQSRMDAFIDSVSDMFDDGDDE